MFFSCRSTLTVYTLISYNDFYVTKYATMQQLQKKQLPFLFFCKLVSNDAAAQLPPGGPTGPWALRFLTKRKLCGEASLILSRKYNDNRVWKWLQIQYMNQSSFMEGLLTWHTHWWAGYFLFWLPHSGHWQPQGTSGSMHISINERLFSSTGVKRVFFSFSFKIDCICLSQCRGKDPSYCWRY